MSEDEKSKEIEESNNNSAKTNKTLALTCFGIFFFILLISGFGFYLTTRDSDNSKSNSSQNQSNMLTYTNSEGKFSVEYPKDYTMQEDSNGMSAEFTSPDSTIILRAFYVLSNGKTAASYLDGILQLSKDVMPLRTVTEIESSNQKLGSLDGQMRIWKYVTSNSSKVEVRIAAVGGGNMYNISMTCNYDNYAANLPIITKMAESFKTK